MPSVVPLDETDAYRGSFLIGNQRELELEVQRLLCDLPVAQRVTHGWQGAGNGERRGKVESSPDESYPRAESAGEQDEGQRIVGCLRETPALRLQQSTFYMSAFFQ